MNWKSLLLEYFFREKARLNNSISSILTNISSFFISGPVISPGLTNQILSEYSVRVIKKTARNCIFGKCVFKVALVWRKREPRVLGEGKEYHSADLNGVKSGELCEHPPLIALIYLTAVTLPISIVANRLVWSTNAKLFYRPRERGEQQQGRQRELPGD